MYQHPKTGNSNIQSRIQPEKTAKLVHAYLYTCKQTAKLARWCETSLLGTAVICASSVFSPLIAHHQLDLKILSLNSHFNTRGNTITLTAHLLVHTINSLIQMANLHLMNYCIQVEEGYCRNSMAPTFSDLALSFRDIRSVLIIEGAGRV